MEQFLNIFFNQFLGEPSILLAIVTMIGYIALKKDLKTIITGGIKTVVGFRILQVGSATIISVFNPLVNAITEKIGIQGVILDPYAGLAASTSALENISALSWLGYSMLVGFSINIILVYFNRWTKLKVVFLSGHVMYVQAALASWSVYHLSGGNISGLEVILLSGLFLGIYWSVCSHLTYKPCEVVTDGAGFAIGHQQMFGIWLVSKIARKLGNPEDSIENVKLPKFLSIFYDNIAASGIIMFIFFGTLMLMLGPEYISTMTELPGKNWIIKIILTSLTFPIGVTVILTGVKLFVAELITSFEGIQQKFIPGAIISVDCAVIFGFASEVVIYGFIFGVIGQFIAIISLIIFNSPILALPGFIPMFFDNATLGIFANKFGGRRALIICCILSGLIQIYGGVYAATLSGLVDPTLTNFQGWSGSFDLSSWWVIWMEAYRWIYNLFH